MPFVMRGDSHIVLPILVPFHMPMVLEFDVRIDDTLHDHAFFGDEDGALQYRYTRGRRHLIDWQGQEARFGLAAHLNPGQWHHIELGWMDETGAVVVDQEPLVSIFMPRGAVSPLLFGAHSTNGGASYLSPLRGSLRHIKLWVRDKLCHWWPIHEGQGLVVHDIIGGAHGTIHKGLGAWRVETSPTAPPVESMSEGMMRSMV